MRCKPCMQVYLGLPRKAKCSCQTMMKKFSYECVVMPNPWPKPKDAQDRFYDAIEWVFENTQGEFVFGYSKGNFYVHFSNPRDGVLYKMFWS